MIGDLVNKEGERGYEKKQNSVYIFSSIIIGDLL